jgi:hypothetical protein
MPLYAIFQLPLTPHVTGSTSCEFHTHCFSNNDSNFCPKLPVQKLHGATLDTLKFIEIFWFFVVFSIQSFEYTLIYLREWFDFMNSPFKKFACLSLQKEVNFDPIIACFKLLGVQFDGDKLYEEFASLHSEKNPIIFQ